MKNCDRIVKSAFRCKMQGLLNSQHDMIKVSGEFMAVRHIEEAFGITRCPETKYFARAHTHTIQNHHIISLTLTKSKTPDWS